MRLSDSRLKHILTCDDHHSADELGQWAIKTEYKARITFSWMLLVPLTDDEAVISLCKAALEDTDLYRTSAARFAPLVAYYYAEGEAHELLDSLLEDCEEAAKVIEEGTEAQSDVTLRSRIWLLQWIEVSGKWKRGRCTCSPKPSTDANFD